LALIRLAKQYGRYGYRKIAELLRIEGWTVNHKKVERIWREEGLQLWLKLLSQLPLLLVAMKQVDCVALVIGMRLLAQPAPALPRSRTMVTQMVARHFIGEVWQNGPYPLIRGGRTGRRSNPAIETGAGVPGPWCVIHDALSWYRVRGTRSWAALWLTTGALCGSFYSSGIRA
jgi:hypothetical protein